jgi:serine/threonine protein phosphatase PrpC
MHVKVGAAAQPAVGQKICGDVSAIVRSPHATLLCLADGLGHGPEANVAATAACRYVEAHAAEPLERLMRGADEVLATLRGAAVSVLEIDVAAARVRFAGVGNVELRAVAHTRVAPPTAPGVLGRGVRRVRVWEYPIAEGDLFVLISDGISSRFELEPMARLGEQALAERLVANHHKSHDDASCVVARVAAGDA